jgi:hypothetical protein
MKRATRPGSFRLNFEVARDHPFEWVIFTSSRLSGFVFIHKQVLFPLRARLGVMAKQYVIEAQPQEFLRREQRHPRLLGRSIAFPLVALDARRNQVRRSTFAALRPGKYVVKRQVLRVAMLPAVLAPVAVADVNPSTLHRRFGTIATDVDVVTEPHHRGHGECRGRRMKNVIPIVLLDVNGTAKPQAHRPRHTDSSKRLVRKIQQQYSSGQQTHSTSIPRPPRRSHPGRDSLNA